MVYITKGQTSKMSVPLRGKKNKKNQRKHGVSFEAALKVFSDPKQLEVYDFKHSLFEDRWTAVGLSGVTVLSVTFTKRNGSIRIISARKADKNEEERYFYGYSAL